MASPLLAIALFEMDADPPGRTPYNMAEAHRVIGLDDQRKIVGNADRAFDFEASSSFRNIADNAIDAGCMVKRDRPGL